MPESSRCPLAPIGGSPVGPQNSDRRRSAGQGIGTIERPCRTTTGCRDSEGSLNFFDDHGIHVEEGDDATRAALATQEFPGDLRAEVDDVGEFDPEQREGLERARVGQRPGVDDIEAERLRQLRDGRLGVVVISADEHAGRLAAERGIAVITGAGRVEGFDDGGAASELGDFLCGRGGTIDGEALKELTSKL